MGALDQLLLEKYRDTVKETCYLRSFDRTAGQGRVPEDSQEAGLPSVAVDAAGDAHYKAAWEVDRFLWPEICDQLETELSKTLDATVQLLRGKCSPGRNVLLMASSHRRTGRTTLLLTLARKAAALGLRVAVVDLDYRRPGLAAQLGIDAEVGIEALSSGVETADSIGIAAVEDGVVLLPMVGKSDGKRCAADEVGVAIQRVAEYHDLVLVDATPDIADLPTLYAPAFQWGAVIVNDSQIDGGDDDRAEISEHYAGRNIWTAGVIENFAA